MRKSDALRGLAANCQNVNDKALALLPEFPALRELTSIGVSDKGFRHVGKCVELEALTCMYCRETGDAATEQIAGFNKLKSYYAGATQITDRSLEIFGGMTSLERVELFQCLGVTDAGVGHLTGLPKLKEIKLSAMPGVTHDVAERFRRRVHVDFTS